MPLCGKTLPDRANAKYDPPGLHKCHRLSGHSGRCAEFPFLDHLKTVAPKVRQKVIRDATKTTGASWKSADAGPNRISRWTMTFSDDELNRLGIDMGALKPWVVAKLREKGASYENCIHSAQYLTWSVYNMENAPRPPSEICEYLEQLFGPIEPDLTTCLVCKSPLDFKLFGAAKRGKAEIETAHASPRQHTPGNVGFAHRPCNIAQGDKTLDEFYDWIGGILERTRGD